MIDGYALSSFDGSFSGEAVLHQGDSAMRVISPWIPVWEQGDPTEVGNGFLVRPTYYPENGFTDDNHQVQAVASTYATHRGGIAQGPFEAPPGTEISLTALVRHVPPAGVMGDPISWIGLAYAEDDASIIAAPMSLSGPRYESYNEWSMMYYRTTTTERLFYVVLLSEWKWRASYCCALWDRAILTYTLPERRSELGGVIRLPWSGGVLRITYEFEEANEC